jgi:hypothetical protein
MGGLIAIYAVVLLDFGHNISPMVLAWSHAEFRSVILRRPIKFIALPLSLLVAGVFVGIATETWWTDFHPFINSALSMTEIYPPRATNPFWWLLAVYLVWNFYHFAKQNFGVMQIYRRKSEVQYPRNQRRIDLAFCMVTQAAVVSAVFLFIFFSDIPLSGTVRLLFILLAGAVFMMVAREAAITGRYWTPRGIFAASQILCFLWPGLLVMAANGINHWLVAMGLASHVDGVNRNRTPLVFAGAVIVLGILLFWALFHKHGVYSWRLRPMIELALPFAGFRLALGFVHFLYDCWVWKLSDPQVQATIGRDLFPHPALKLVVV